MSEEEEELHAMYDFMMKGDNRCALKINDRVQKANSEEGDTAPNGAKGIVVGSMHVPIASQFGKHTDAYLVQFDEIQGAAFITGAKLEYIEDDFKFKIVSGKKVTEDAKELARFTPNEYDILAFQQTAGMEEATMKVLELAELRGFKIPEVSEDDTIYITKEGEEIIVYLL